MTETVTLPAGLWADIQRFMASAPASAFGNAPIAQVAQTIAIIQAAQAQQDKTDDPV